MWLKILTFLFVINTGSCATTEVEITAHRGRSVEKSFVHHIQKFEKDCNVKVEVHMRFTDIKKELIYMFSSNTVAYCLMEPIGIVHIDKDWWMRNANENRREELIYHELGHCTLGRILHNNKKDKEGRDISIMSENLFSNHNQYRNNKKKYIKELCGK